MCMTKTTCIWSVLTVFDPFDLYMFYSAPFGLSDLYLIEIAWIDTLGSILHVYDLLYKYLIDLSCVRLFQPLYIQLGNHLAFGQCNMCMTKTCIWSILTVFDLFDTHFWPVYDLFTLCWVDLTCILVKLPEYDQFGLYIICSTWFSWFKFRLINTTWIL